MQLDPIGSRAIQSLSVDVSNLTARLAIMTGMIEEMASIVAAMDPSTWTHTPIPAEEGDTSENQQHLLARDYITTLPGSEMNKIQSLLQLIRSMN